MKPIFEKMYTGMDKAPGMNGVDIPVNSNGYMVNPADYVPEEALKKIKEIGDYRNSEVQDLLRQMPSQQAYDVAKRILHVEPGTVVPCSEMERLKIGSDATPPPDSGDGGGGGTTPPDDGGGDGGGEETTPPDDGGGSGPGSGEGLGWFASNWKAIAIGAVITGGILAAIHAIGNTIKGRFNKAAKILTRMQHDFITEKDGMDMKKVLPGAGLQLVDWITRTFFGQKKDKRGKNIKDGNKGALGLHPFVDGIRAEIKADYEAAAKAFNAIAMADEGKDGGVDNSSESLKESYDPYANAPVYESFKEAFSSQHINEFGIGAITTGISMASSLVGLIKNIKGVSGGEYVGTQTDEDGNEKPFKVKITKESTRDICFSIINNFMSKYINVRAVSQKLGIDIEDLGSIDKSDIDKFEKLIRQYNGKNNRTSVGMYARIKKNYDAMLKHYSTIGKTVINNFQKFTLKKKGNDLGEKDSNLLTASFEKLNAAWEKQYDWLENNFMHIITEIVSDKYYVSYFDFIIEKVFPVFKTGLAGDADYVIDGFPHKGQFYFLRQTLDQPINLDYGLDITKNVACAKIISFDENTKKVTFKLIARLKDPSDDIEDIDNYEMDFYKGDDGKARVVKDLDYKKWISLDPNAAPEGMFTDDEEEETGDVIVYKRTVNDFDGYAIAVTTAQESRSINKTDKGDKLFEEEPDNNEGNIKAIIYGQVKKDGDVANAEGVKNITVNFSKDEIERVMTSTSDDSKMNMDFHKVDNQDEANRIKDSLSSKKDGATPATAEKTEEIPPIINGEGNAEDNEDHSTDFMNEIAKVLCTVLERGKDNTWNFKQGIQLNNGVYTVPGDGYKYIVGATVAKGENNQFKITIPEKTAFLQNEAGERIDLKDYPITFADEAEYSKPQSNESYVSEAGDVAQGGQVQQKTSNSSKTDNSTTNTQDNSNNSNNATGGTVTINFGALPEILKGNESSNSKYAELEKRMAEMEANFKTITDENAKLKAEAEAKKVAAEANAAIQSDQKVSDEDKQKAKEATEKIQQGDDNQQPTQTIPAKCSITLENTKLEIANADNGMPNFEKVSEVVRKVFETILKNNKSKLVIGKNDAVSDSFKVTYKPSSSMYESSTSASFTRNISCKLRHPERYHVLSMCAWNDGTSRNTVKSLRESMLTLFHKARGYRDFAKAARESHFVHLSQFNESMSVTVPSSRYNMFEAGNPLLEYVVVIGFDKDGHVDEIYNTGIHKINR